MKRQSLTGATAPTSRKREWRAENPVILAYECVHMCAWQESGTKSKIILDQTRRSYQNWKAES